MTKIRLLLAAFLMLPVGAAHAQAISALPAASALGGTEVGAVVQGGTTKKATINQIQTYVLTGNAATATALAANPSDCSANTFATTIAANGNLTCAAVAIGGGVSGLGTGIATALAVNVGSAGAPVVLNGAGGTPSSMTGTNITGTASGLTAGTVTTNANLTGDVTSSGNATTLATVNSNVGSFTNSSITVNAKGLVTAASSGAAGAILGANTFTALQTITQASANAGIIASTGYSLTGSDATGMVNLAGTLNTSGNPVALKIALTNTASGSTTKFVSFLAGAAGATEVFSIGKDGRPQVTQASNLAYGIFGTTIGIGRHGSIAGLDLYAGAGTGIDNEAIVNVGTVKMTLKSTTQIAWANTSVGSTAELFLSSGGAAILQHGAANAASPVAQIAQAQGSRAGTDTNTAGANFTFRPGAGTGTATPASLILATYVPVASGTGVQTSTPALTLDTALTLGSHVVTPASSGTRYLCISTAGVVTSSASACSGT